MLDIAALSGLGRVYGRRFPAIATALGTLVSNFNRQVIQFQLAPNLTTHIGAHIDLAMHQLEGVISGDSDGHWQDQIDTNAEPQ